MVAKLSSASTISVKNGDSSSSIRMGTHPPTVNSLDADLATAVPVPMAMPISARFKAGASLTPSPVCVRRERSVRMKERERVQHHTP